MKGCCQPPQGEQHLRGPGSQQLLLCLCLCVSACVVELAALSLAVKWYFSLLRCDNKPAGRPARCARRQVFNCCHALICAWPWRLLVRPLRRRSVAAPTPGEDPLRDDAESRSGEWGPRCRLAVVGMNASARAGAARWQLQRARRDCRSARVCCDRIKFTLFVYENVVVPLFAEYSKRCIYYGKSVVGSCSWYDL